MMPLRLLVEHYERQHLRYLAVVLMALQVMDLATTALSLQLGGSEGNAFVNSLGWPLAIAGKTAITAAFIVFATRTPYRFGRRLFYIANTYMAAVVVWNLLIIWKLS